MVLSKNALVSAQCVIEKESEKLLCLRKKISISKIEITYA